MTVSGTLRLPFQDPTAPSSPTAWYDCRVCWYDIHDDDSGQDDEWLGHGYTTNEGYFEIEVNNDDLCATRDPFYSCSDQDIYLVVWACCNFARFCPRS
ncbi:MAG: hypothetical protein QOD77_360 [Thermoplasmata archaeon]|jgi:hypothetical protein|nr:hypothetical protein [Thermoplasmata archaeon]